MQHISVLNKLMYSLAVAPILTGCAIEGAASSNDEASIGQDVADGSGEGSSATPPDILDPQTAPPSDPPAVTSDNVKDSTTRCSPKWHHGNDWFQACIRLDVTP